MQKKNPTLGCVQPSSKLGWVCIPNPFNDPEVNQTSLSHYIHELKERQIEPTVSWKIVDRGQTYSPINGVCQLCTREAFHIIFHPESAELNSRSEIFSACRHKKSKLLFPPVRKKKTNSPGT